VRPARLAFARPPGEFPHQRAGRALGQLGEEGPICRDVAERVKSFAVDAQFPAVWGPRLNSVARRATDRTGTCSTRPALWA
jgi:hypothetical protein